MKKKKEFVVFDIKGKVGEIIKKKNFFLLFLFFIFFLFHWVSLITLVTVVVAAVVVVVISFSLSIHFTLV